MEEEVTQVLSTEVLSTEDVDFNDLSSVAAWKDDVLVPMEERRGVKTLIRAVNRYVSHFSLAKKNLADIFIGVSSVNGERTVKQKRGDTVRKQKTVARKFYESLNTNDLSRQCSLYDLSYDNYETMEEAIEAIITARFDS